MKATLSLFALITVATMTACSGAAPEELGTQGAALLGVEPDEIDARKR